MVADITGLGLITPWGTSLSQQVTALREGRSTAINWENGYSKVGAPLPQKIIEEWETRWEPDQKVPTLKRKLDRLLRGSSFPVRVGVIAAIEAMTSAGYSLFQEPEDQFGVVICGHQMLSEHLFDNHHRFQENPDFIDPLFGLTGIDTYVGSVISELFGLKGPCLLVGAACASGNMGLMIALDQIRSGRVTKMLVVAPPCELHPLPVHSWVMLNAINFQSFQSEPTKASRPFDAKRAGFIPAQTSAAMVLEKRTSTPRPVWARLSGAAANSNAHRQTQPDEAMALSLMVAACRDAGLSPQDLSAINAHAASTPVGDAVEARAITQLVGSSVPVQATKSLLGHSLSASALTEAVICVLQIRDSFLHPSINLIESEAPQLDLVTGSAREQKLNHILSNAFGFGGLNASVVISR